MHGTRKKRKTEKGMSEKDRRQVEKRHQKADAQKKKPENLCGQDPVDIWMQRTWEK